MSGVCMSGCRSNWVVLSPCRDRGNVTMGASRVVGVLVVASEAVDARTPVDAGQVVNTVGKGQELVLVIGCAVVVTVGASAHCHWDRMWVWAWQAQGATHSKNWQYQ
jgi:hypothetical protein